MKELTSRIDKQTLEVVKVSEVNKSKGKTVLIKDSHRGYVLGNIKDVGGVISYKLERLIPGPMHLKTISLNYDNIDEFYVLDEKK